MVLTILIPFLAISFLALRQARSGLNRAISPDASCRGLVSVKESAYDTRTIEGRERMFVRVELENRSAIDVSDPVIRVLITGPDDKVEDTFTRTAYGVNIAPRKPYWLRVDGDITVEPVTIKEVRAEVASADCKPAWE